jgi:hypothetical protein
MGNPCPSAAAVARFSAAPRRPIAQAYRYLPAQRFLPLKASPPTRGDRVFGGTERLQSQTDRTRKPRRRVARAFDLSDITNTVGYPAPSRFGEGRVPRTDTQRGVVQNGQSLHRHIGTHPVDKLGAGSCKKRKHKAPLIPTSATQTHQ